MKSIMNDAELYQKNNTLQKRDALQCLEEYASKIKWNNRDRIIDIGCGDGSVTSILKGFLPEHFELLVGCDISEIMVNFANKHYADDKTSFTTLDIEGDVPGELRRDFDHAFSFYVLHWIRHQETAFTNIYNLLAEGGDCLVMFLGHMPVYDVYRVLSQNRKWSPWLKDVDRYVSPYHDSQEPEKEIRRMMEKIGFKDISVQCKEKVIVYDNFEHVKKAVKAIQPFKFPKDLYEDFLEDYVDVVRDMELISEVNNNIEDPVKVKANYTLIIAYGSR